MLAWALPGEALAQRMELSGRVMTGFEYELEKPSAEQGDPRTEEYGFFVRQARFQLEAEIEDRFELEVSAELSDGLNPKISAFDMNRPQYIRDAYLDARHSRELRLRAGHFKRPFSRLANTSAGNLPVRGRGLLDGVLLEDGRWGDRALGAMLWGKLRSPDLDWSLAVMNPNWAPTTRNDGYDLIGRLEWEPVKWLELGIDGGRKSLEIAGSNVSGHAAGGDVRVRVRDATVHIEGSYGDLVFEPDVPAAFGGHVLGSYDIELSPLFVLQPVVFVEYADAHSVFLESESLRIVAGANLVGHDVFRVMPQASVTRPLGPASDFNPWPEKYEYYLMLTLDL